MWPMYEFLPEDVAMPRCPICQSDLLKTSRTRWWEKVQGRLVWRRECHCQSCGWAGWLTSEALPGAAIQVRIVEAHDQL
jgi:uncharacterized protein with PIN domain